MIRLLTECAPRDCTLTDCTLPILLSSHDSTLLGTLSMLYAQQQLWQTMAKLQLRCHARKPIGVPPLLNIRSAQRSIVGSHHAAHVVSDYQIHTLCTHHTATSAAASHTAAAASDSSMLSRTAAAASDSSMLQHASLSRLARADLSSYSNNR